MSPATILKMYLVSLFIVFLHFAAQVKYWTAPSNRYFFQWERATAAALVLDVFLIAMLVTLLAVGLRAVTRRFQLARVQRALDHLLPLALLSGLLSLFPGFFHDHPKLVPLIWMAAMLALGFSLASPRSPLVKYALNVSLVFSLAPLLLSVQILSWESWRDPPRTEFAARAAHRPTTPVFVFVFDEWSYLRSTSSGELRSLFENVRRMADRSVVFRQARSPYNHTSLSLPRLIYQNDLELARKDTQLYWVEGEEQVLSSRVPSLFQTARNHDYNTFMLGWHLPYGRLLGGQPDYCVSYRSAPAGRNVLEEMPLALQRNLQFWTDPVSRKAREEIDPRLDSRNFYRMSTRFRREMLRIIADSPPNTFAVFHVPQPHGPHVFEPDGSYAGPYSLSGPYASDYDRALRHLDFYVGEIIECFRDSGKLDKALIIMTSDHARIAEKEPLIREVPEWNRRVPLIVKLPGQESGLVTDETIATNRLRPLFEMVFSGEQDTRRLMELLLALPASLDSDGYHSASACHDGSVPTRSVAASYTKASEAGGGESEQD